MWGYDRQECLGVRASDGQERSSCAAGLFATLFPALQGSHGHPQQCGKLRLRQPCFFASVCHWGQHHLNLPRLHFPN